MYVFSLHLSLELGQEVVKVPSCGLPDLPLGVVRKAVEVGELLGSGEVEEGQVDIVRVAITLHDESGRLKVAAENPQLGAGGGQQGLLHGVDQHVQDPQLPLGRGGGRRGRGGRGQAIRACQHQNHVNNNKNDDKNLVIDAALTWELSTILAVLGRV